MLFRSASASNAHFGTIARYGWSFGDGINLTTATPTIFHTYAAPGTYPITATITDAGGNSQSATTQSVAS